MPAFMTVRDLCLLFRRSHFRIRAWIHEGKFPNAKKVVDGWLIPESDVTAYLNACPVATDLPPDKRKRGGAMNPKYKKPRRS